MTLFILLFLAHCIDDFYIQPMCLTYLKQKKWWKHNTPPDKYDMYKNDYRMALAIHAFEWSAALSLVLFLFDAPEWYIATMFFVNGVIHYIIDDIKANMLAINLIVDQSIHILQLAFTATGFYLLS